MAILIRAATDGDFAAITAIYAWNVLNGTGTFALEPPSEADMLASFHSIQSLRLPYLVAVDGDEVVGYAYASQFRPRPAYRYGVEDSLYLAPGHVGKGIGKALLNELITQCTARGLYTMIAVIGDRDNGPSIGVHRACGFTETGTLPRAGFKFGRWLDVVFMTRDLLPQTDSPEGDGWAG
ncbi:MULTISPECIES: GNAT family N-acetyltransferase [Asticcacaulis]|uniref:GNAT family N-acetyltransferase n=1 Tax=Asticcacaulis TaxID=76890 RepID=UPI001AEB3A3A|nr:MULTISPECIES: GNAT family N-acetyltransferase [Asticcacaulis]MBP2158849.1 phosphinothricin acetyltransferase [Asticcacaulis solisilvae]MDR6799895.1 phosphinothricin acetyltransferase [Asticcacaulis sp. BE141]